VPAARLLLSGLMLFSTAAMSAFGATPASGIVIDDDEAEFVGQWKQSSASRGFIGTGYRHDQAEGKGEKTATFSVAVPADGKYQVLISYTATSNRAPTVPIVVSGADGESVVYVDQTKPPALKSGYQPLGEFSLRADQPVKVVFQTADTTGHVIVDAVRLLTPEQFEKAKQEPPLNPAVAKAKAETKTEPPPEPPAFVKRQPSQPHDRLTPEELDQMLESQVGHVMDAPLVSDAWFLRRVAHDLVGRQPTLEELREFESDSSADKRSRAVDRLLALPEYGRN
jgi:hypothetical protein